MSKFLYAIFLTLALACAAGAQTRRGTTTTRSRPATGATAKPTPQPTPAARPTATATGQGTGVSTPNGTASGKANECGCEDKPLPEVLAVVNGVKVTQGDFSQQVQQQVQVYQQEVIEARKTALDVLIENMLVDAEAKKRGVSSEKLLQDEVVAKTVEPTQADAQKYFNDNRAGIEQQAGRAVDFQEIKDDLIRYLRGQRQQDRWKQFVGSLRTASDLKMLATAAAAPADRTRVLATLNGKSINAGEVEDTLIPLISQVQEQVYLLRKSDIDLKINDMLLAQEAQKRGVTTRALYESEIASKIPVITEAQALDFYNKNKERIPGEFPQVKYQIIEFLQGEEQRKIGSALVERLRNAASIQTFLTPPAPPVFQIATDDQPAKGKEDASVTLVEFTDYQCPTCAKTQPILEQLISEYGERIRLVVRDFPLQMHADARKAAEAAEAAREQGKYWDFTAILFRNQSKLGVDSLKQYASVLGLDRAKFDSALDTGKFAGKVDRDVSDGQRLGVTGTPTIFVNGKRMNDVTYEGLKAAIEAALKK
jgi:protein-disulfide isomerase